MKTWSLMEVHLNNKILLVLIASAVLVSSLTSCKKIPLASDQVPTQAGTLPASPIILLETSLSRDYESQVSHLEVYDPELKAFIQIQTIAQDTREIPEDIWVGHQPGLRSVAVYVKVRAGDQTARDPFFSGVLSSGSGIVSASSGILLSATGCITGGLGGSENGFLPPAPGYLPENDTLQAGEIREGWVICPAYDKEIADQHFIWMSGPGYAPITLWSPAENINIGGWINIPEMTVADGSGSVVYTGPGFMSVQGMEIIRDVNSLLPFNDIASPGECSGVTAVISGKTECISRTDNLVGRIKVRFASPEMPENVSNKTDLVVRNIPVQIGTSENTWLASDGTQDLPFTGWVNVKLPDSVSDLSVVTEVGSRRVVWAQEDITISGVSSETAACASGRCLGPLTKENLDKEEYGYAQDLLDAFDGKRPYFCPGETSLGISLGTPIVVNPKSYSIVSGGDLDYADYTDPSMYNWHLDTERLVYVPVTAINSGLITNSQPRLVSFEKGILKDAGYVMIGSLLGDSENPVFVEYGEIMGGLSLNKNAYLEIHVPSDIDIASLYLIFDNHERIIRRLSCEN